MTRRGVVFLDKDGTLIEDLPYNVEPSRVRWAPGALRALRAFAAARLAVAIITNQSGVARGFFGLSDLARLAGHLEDELRALDVPLLGFYACPHLPEGINEFAIDCECRKPRPGLLERAARELGADVGASWMVGDTWMDVAAGQAVGCGTILVGSVDGALEGFPEGLRPDHAVADLGQAARIIIAGRSPSERPLASLLDVSEPDARAPLRAPSLT